MTGTGTQDDPIIVENESEFREAIDKFGVYVDCAEGMLFDYEGRQEDVPIFTVRAREIHGNGLTIKNGRFDHAIIEVIQYTADVGNPGTNNFNFFDINIENNIFTNTAPLFQTPYDVKHYGKTIINFYRSEITQKINSPVKKSGNNESNFFIRFYSSNLTFDRLPSAGQSLINQVEFKDCNIFLYDGENTDNPFGFTNSHYNYISGRFNMNIGNTLLQGCSDLIFDLEPKTDGTKYEFHSHKWSPNTKSVVYNSDVITETHVENSEFIPTGLNSEELHNAAKLAAAGIAIDPSGG